MTRRECNRQDLETTTPKKEPQTGRLGLAMVGGAVIGGVVVGIFSTAADHDPTFPTVSENVSAVDYGYSVGIDPVSFINDSKDLPEGSVVIVQPLTEARINFSSCRPSDTVSHEAAVLSLNAGLGRLTRSDATEALRDGAKSDIFGDSITCGEDAISFPDSIPYQLTDQGGGLIIPGTLEYSESTGQYSRSLTFCKDERRATDAFPIVGPAIDRIIGEPRIACEVGTIAMTPNIGNS